MEERKNHIAWLNEGDAGQRRLAALLSKCRNGQRCHLEECAVCERQKLIERRGVPASIVKSIGASYAIVTIYLDRIRVIGKRRPLNEQKVRTLAASIDKVGLQTPISVHRRKNDVLLVCGWHRLEAVKRLGWNSIKCTVLVGDDIQQRLWQTDENLCRAELTVLQRAEAIAQKRDLIRQLPEEGQVAPPGGRQPNEMGINKSAKVLGMTREEVHLSASDLVGHLNCRYLTALDLAVARGELDKPAVWDPVLDVLAQRGAIHEERYLDHLVHTGFPVTQIEGVGIGSFTVSRTLDAMRAGAPIIAQGALRSANWGGRVDVLRRIDKPSGLGEWSYEVIDTKLARETKGNTVLQICLYSDLLAESQQLIPEFSHVVTPGSDFIPEEFRFSDYAAYYRRVRKSLEAAVKDGSGADLYPEPKPHCDICRWRTRCEAKWRADDHLSLVAGISKSQIGELEKRGVNTVVELAAIPLPLPWKPDRGAAESYARITAELGAGGTQC
ncbi:MAG TPA: TM0106 family RecB-like putative nuclease [Gemmataceae bacterium]